MCIRDRHSIIEAVPTSICVDSYHMMSMCLQFSVFETDHMTSYPSQAEAVVKFEYKAQQHNELNLRVGDIVTDVHQVGSKLALLHVRPFTNSLICVCVCVCMCVLC